MDMGMLKKQIEDAFYKETGKRRRGRPRKSDEEKLAARRAYQHKWYASLSEERKAKRIASNRKSHDKWVANHREEWNTYQREYKREQRKKSIDKTKSE